MIKPTDLQNNLFMTHHENKWLNSEKSSTVLFYK